MKDEYKEMVCRVRFIDGVHAQTYLSDVEIVRCKDCKHWNYEDSGTDGTSVGECFMLSMMTDDMCFCCWAKRRKVNG